jgi:cytochrome c oxidase assembly factor CtaG
VNSSIDLVTLVVAVGLLALVLRAAARTRSRAMRIALAGFAALVMGLMLWNLATRGGLHAV